MKSINRNYFLIAGVLFGFWLTAINVLDINLPVFITSDKISSTIFFLTLIAAGASFAIYVAKLYKNLSFVALLVSVTTGLLFGVAAFYITIFSSFA